MKKKKKTLLIATMALSTAANFASARHNVDPAHSDNCVQRLITNNMENEYIYLGSDAFAEYNECLYGAVLTYSMNNSHLITDDKDYKIMVQEMFDSIIETYDGDDLIRLGRGRLPGKLINSKILTHSGNDLIYLSNVNACTVSAGKGSDMVLISGNIYDLDLDMGRGDDVAILASNLPLRGQNQIETTVIDMGPGHDILKLRGSEDSYNIEENGNETYISYKKSSSSAELIILKNCDEITFLK